MARKKTVRRRRKAPAAYRRRRNAALDRELSGIVKKARTVRDEIMERIAKGLLPKRNRKRR